MKLSKSQRAQLFAMFDGRCAYCGAALPEKGWHADHVEAVIRKAKLVRTEDFGRYKYVQTGECFAPENDRLSNLMPSCRPCNIDKATLDLEGWRRALEEKVDVLRKNYSAWRHAERFGLVAQIGTKVTFYFELPIRRKGLISAEGRKDKCIPSLAPKILRALGLSISIRALSVLAIDAAALSGVSSAGIANTPQCMDRSMGCRQCLSRMAMSGTADGGATMRHGA